MPELPDLIVFAENLMVSLKGKKVQFVDYHKDKRLNVSHMELRNALCQTSVALVQRSGKEIEFLFSNKTTLFVHLMLAGRFSIVKDPDSIKFKVLTVIFDDGASLVVSDPKNLVTIKLNPVPSTVPDALEIDGAYLRRKISEKPRTLAKAFLIDQAIVRGIGNAYADEILWQAKISPKSAVGKIPAHVIDELLASIKSVLTGAVKEIKGSVQKSFPEKCGIFCAFIILTVQKARQAIGSSRSEWHRRPHTSQQNKSCMVSFTPNKAPAVNNGRKGKLPLRSAFN